MEWGIVRVEGVEFFHLVWGYVGEVLEDGVFLWVRVC